MVSSNNEGDLHLHTNYLEGMLFLLFSNGYFCYSMIIVICNVHVTNEQEIFNIMFILVFSGIGWLIHVNCSISG